MDLFYGSLHGLFYGIISWKSWDDSSIRQPMKKTAPVILVSGDLTPLSIRVSVSEQSQKFNKLAVDFLSSS